MVLPMSTIDTITTSMKLGPDLRARVQRLAQARDRSAHWILRSAVERFVEQEERRESFRADALAAWNEYQATGEHISGAEADAWFEKFTTESQAEDAPSWR